MNRTLLTPAGTEWHLENVVHKLTLRAGLPGARVYDLAADALRASRAAGVSREHRLALALPGSWMVNSPAISRVMRRWALEPVRRSLLALVQLVEDGPDGWQDETAARAQVLARLLPTLGDEPYLLEATSKVLALLAPELVPLLPAPALAFLLGADAPADAASLARVLDCFAAWSIELEDDLAGVAAELGRAGLPPLDPAQVLDRLLWFDSEGHRHFTAKSPDAAPQK
jgi:hypothetical protein